MNLLKIQTFVLIAFLTSCKSTSQTSIDKAYIKELVRKIGTSYVDNYAIPEKGKEVNTFLVRNLESGKYNDIASYDSLASKVKQDIFEVTNDKHIQIRYKAAKNNPEETSGNDDSEQPRPQSPAEFFTTIENYGLTNIEIKNGDIGYVKMLAFYPIQMDAKAKDAVDVMMKKFENCKSIIFDLTECRGGDPNMVSYLTSYLFPKEEKVHLNSFYYRPNESTMDFYTQEVNGAPLPDVKIYVLTSCKTFSAGEEFSYNLKNLKRATIIGEVTGGGAHAVEPRTIDDQFDMMLPTGRAINPITKTNWERVGVKPHIEVEAEKVLDEAIKLIMDNF